MQAVYRGNIFDDHKPRVENVGGLQGKLFPVHQRMCGGLQGWLAAQDTWVFSARECGGLQVEVTGSMKRKLKKRTVNTITTSKLFTDETTIIVTSEEGKHDRIEIKTHPQANLTLESTRPMPDLVKDTSQSFKPPTKEQWEKAMQELSRGGNTQTE